MKKIYLLYAFLMILSVQAQETKEQSVKYRRSSLYTVMVDAPNLPYADSIKKFFINSPIPEKFNDHNLGNRVFTSFASPTEANPVTANEILLNSIAKEAIAKWFNRSEKGGFNMDLIKSRGSYDASVLDIATAKASKRGLDMLADAGEELIKNTFVLVNEFKYTSKEEVAKKASGWLKVVGSVASYVPGGSTVSTISNAAAVGATVAGKGYIVRTNAHLYRLDWNEEAATKFYNEYWADDNTITEEKKQAFDESKIFKLVYVGSDNSWADVQSSIFTKKREEQLVQRATIKAVDAVIIELQKNHEEFKTKTPLFTGEPITAKIGTKEGVSNKSKFEVLEQQIDENGKTSYAVVGSVKVDEDFPIWDNRFGAEDENPDSKIDRTYFKKVSGKDFHPGMLIVQKKGK
ncbi:hypothetical protein [Flavobacterium gawalongense]|uniref:Uncharacterized protein n=1 Tax=Flavobacterium gawalongense TaxID=2594432 RepID=A0A553BX96_9FLAO|nr:hypothetical protein [Flavobacterium gawalongense]TRX04167.1 hypothetical protein FNW33_01420 [Flavobacterium gawalongense]TRX09383.1 hypothetical protein FNW12_02850 [Flavobacterium gawalongense]TRX12803.1 hypothetical protein FNW11_01930 [Flavobacterium gawalongense]TRX13148.1 hypothetical protein FNW10_01925 [Flavobacterium gawalongense]TRX30790.1 hypothetical protein FNW38_03325 [Flavobacterium gawalongense]